MLGNLTDNVDTGQSRIQLVTKKIDKLLGTSGAYANPLSLSCVDFVFLLFHLDTGRYCCMLVLVIIIVVESFLLYYI